MEKQQRSFCQLIQQKFTLRSRLHIAILCFLLTNVSAFLFVLISTNNPRHHGSDAAADVLNQNRTHKRALAEYDSVKRLTEDLIATALSHPLRGPAAVLANGTLVCLLSLMHAFDDDFFLSHESCTIPQLVASLDKAHHRHFANSATLLQDGNLLTVASVLPSRCVTSEFWRQLVTLDSTRAVTTSSSSSSPPSPRRVRAALCPSFEKESAKLSALVDAAFDDALARMTTEVGRRVIASSGDHEAQSQPQEQQQQQRLFSVQRSYPAGARNKTKTIVFDHIGFATPDSNILLLPTDASRRRKRRRRKLFDFMPLLPGEHPHQHGIDSGGYVFRTEDEALYRAFLERSYFAFTHVRGGADCFRHYEILAAGTLPFFSDLPSLQPYSVPHLPLAQLAELVLRGHRFTQLASIGYVSSHSGPVGSAFFHREGVGHINFHAVPTNIVPKPEQQQQQFSSFLHVYDGTQQTLLGFTRDHLTTSALARKVLRRMELSLVPAGAGSTSLMKKILIVGDASLSNYVEQMLLCGLASLPQVEHIVFIGQKRMKELLLRPQKKQRGKTAVVDYERHLRNSAAGAYGNGFGFAGRLDDRSANKIEVFEPHQILGKTTLDLLHLDAVIYTYVEQGPDSADDTSSSINRGGNNNEREATLLLKRYPLLSRILLEAGKNIPIAFVDGTDAGVVAPHLLEQLKESIENEAKNVARSRRLFFFVRELTMRHSRSSE